MDELDNMIVSGAPYGGPIAMVRDKKVVATTKPVITIYNCVGNVISKILVRILFLYSMMTKKD